MENTQQPKKPFIISRKKPVVTYVLVGVCVLIFILDFLLRLYFAWRYNTDVEILKIFGMKINELIAQRAGLAHSDRDISARGLGPHRL